MNRIVIFLVVVIGVSLSSGFIGYRLSDALWLKKQVKVEQAYRDRQERAVAKLSVALTALENRKQEREVVYRDKIKYIKADAPKCSISDDRLHELKCLADPRECGHSVSRVPPSP